MPTRYSLAQLITRVAFKSHLYAIDLVRQPSNDQIALVDFAAVLETAAIAPPPEAITHFISPFGASVWQEITLQYVSSAGMFLCGHDMVTKASTLHTRYYLTQWWNIVNLKLQWNPKWNSYIFIPENAFETTVCEMTANFTKSVGWYKTYPYMIVKRNTRISARTPM